MKPKFGLVCSNSWKIEAYEVAVTAGSVPGAFLGGVLSEK